MLHCLTVMLEEVKDSFYELNTQAYKDYAKYSRNYNDFLSFSIKLKYQTLEIISTRLYGFSSTDVAYSKFHKLTKEDFDGYDSDIVEYSFSSSDTYPYEFVDKYYVTGGGEYNIENFNKGEDMCLNTFIDEAENLVTEKNSHLLECIVREKIKFNKKEFIVYWKMLRTEFDSLPREMKE